MKTIEFSINRGKKQGIFQIQDDKKQKVRIGNLEHIENLGIYYTDTEKQISERIGNIIWPAQIEKGTINILFNPVSGMGELEIENSEYIWSFDIRDIQEEENTRRRLIQKEEVLKEIEEQEKVLIYAEEMIEEYKKDIFGQDEEIRAISEIIVSERNKKNPGLIVILLMGPTGVGKTQIGKNTAPVLTGLTKEEWGLKIISMNAFKEPHALSRVTSTSPGYVGYGEGGIFAPSRDGKPYVYVLDEFEKVNSEVAEGMMEIFSEGVVQLGDNTEIDLRGRTIIICTTNLSVDMEKYNGVSSFVKKEMCRDVVAKHFGRPEMAGKITNIVAMQDLSDAARLDILEKFVEEILAEYNIDVVYIEKSLSKELLKLMKSTKYGARGIKDAIKTALNHYTAYRGKMNHLTGKKVGLCGSVDHIRLEPCA